MPLLPAVPFRDNAAIPAARRVPVLPSRPRQNGTIDDTCGFTPEPRAASVERPRGKYREGIAGWMPVRQARHANRDRSRAGWKRDREWTIPGRPREPF